MEVKDNKYDLNNKIKCRDKLYNLKYPLVMGVLNMTPDSFYEESRNTHFQDAIAQVHNMVREAVDIIDIGGVSTRPNAALLSSEEEIHRVLPVILEIRKLYPDILLSIDTFRTDVARAAVEAGVDIVNDVYAGRYDGKMFDLIAELDVPYILMHSRGDASDMQKKTVYHDVVMEVCKELSEQLEKLRSMGVKDVIIDPGFGFAKNVEQNYALFEGIRYLEVLECPILVGISRKSMIYKLLNISPKEALNGTTVLNTIGMLNHASIIRVHDVKEAVEVKKILNALRNNN